MILADFERWEDPLPPDMFAPDDDKIKLILEQANGKRMFPALTKRRLGLAVAALVFIIIAAAIFSRMSETLWGGTVLPRGSSSAGNIQPEKAASVFLPPVELYALADAVVCGSFDESGTFILEEQLKGSCPAKITLPVDSMRGWAVLMLLEQDGTWIFAQTPCVFRMEGGVLTARDASGIPVPEYDEAYPGLDMSILRNYR